MSRVAWSALLFLGAVAAVPGAGAADPLRLFEAGQLPSDSRLVKPKTLNDYFPFTPPAGKDQWDARRRAVREQVLVATGLWPMPEKAPLRPVIHGKIDRNEYTIEKVFFASYAGHYVSGNLYRPKGKSGKLPGVLCPHGHWRHGRFTDELTDRGKDGEKYVRDQIVHGAEKTIEGARYPLQARCAQLARMGCVVFHYDMVGYADSKLIPHRTGFMDADAELRLQSFMGLQTFNTIRALDFLLSLPEVDGTRIGVTGASGGGTQTFILGAIDDRPAVAFPAVMVSTAMQGGCVCENCSLLRQGTGNVEFAGLFAPKPLGMTGAHDWTIDIETKGLPQLKALYKLYGTDDGVMASCFPQFGHNYNQISREVMYKWFNRHLHLGLPEPVTEQPFVPVPPKELSVYDERHRLRKDALGAEDLRKTMTEASDKQIEALHPHDAAGLKRFREVIGTALRVMVNDRLPRPEEVEERLVETTTRNEVGYRKVRLSRKGAGEDIPAVVLVPARPSGKVVVWIHSEGKASLAADGKLVPAAWRLLEKNVIILAPDVFLTGEFQEAPRPAVDEKYAGYTFGYNRPLLANRVHDILTVLAYARSIAGVERIDLVGWEKAGPWVVLARVLCGDAVGRTAADVHRFRFESVRTVTDEMMLPGALKYGGLGTLAALCSPGELFLHNKQGTSTGKIIKDAYQAAGAAEHFYRLGEKATPDQVVDWLLR